MKVQKPTNSFLHSGSVRSDRDCYRRPFRSLCLLFSSIPSPKYLPCHIHAARRCMGQRVCHAAAVTDHIQPLVSRLKVLVDIDLHVVELDLHTVQQCIVICRSGRDLVQGIDHLDDAVEDPLWQHKA